METFNSLRTKVNVNYFEPKLIYPYSGVRKSDRDALRAQWQAESDKLQGQFKIQLCGVIMNELNCKLQQAEIIYNHAWDDGHSGGYSEVIHHAQSLTDLIKAFNTEG